MTETPRLATDRFLSLDVFRGLTMAGMILVNNPGDWKHVYGPLLHVEWNGWTPTDLVFPFFLFIVGVAITFSFDKRLARGESRTQLLAQIVRRTIVIFLLGLTIPSFPNPILMAPQVAVIVGLYVLPSPGADPSDPARRRVRQIIGLLLLVGGVAWFFFHYDYFQQSHPPVVREGTVLRVPGVLQRIALCYFAASLIVMTTGARGRSAWTAALLIGYCVIVKTVSAPGTYVAETPELLRRPDGWLHDWIDLQVFGRHVYGERPDPEGLLSTIPAIATTLCGVLAGNWLHGRRDGHEKASGLFFFGSLALFAGLCLDFWFPINKKIWTSSYVLLTAGLALTVLAMCYWLIDLKGYRRWTWPFLVFGTNAIFVYVASGFVTRILLYTPAGGTSVRSWVYQHWFTPAFQDPKNASLAFAIAYVLFWLIVATPLYLRRIFVKI